MNCPSPTCRRPNPDGHDFCDYCGTPLGAAASTKRKTEMEAAPAAPAKRATEMEAAPAAAPYDPFAPPPGRAVAPPPGPAPAPAPAQPAAKRRTEFDGGAEAHVDPKLDPFGATMGPSRGHPPAPAPAPAPQAQPRPAARPAPVGRRIVGFLVTFDRAPDGAFHVIREGRNLIGRDDACDIVIGDDETISGTHAVLISRGGRTVVDDEKSQNGTKLNGEEVMHKTDVVDGDVITLGHRTRLLCRLLDHDKVAALWKPAGS
jgi:hypothetical protein